jgi:hypothetical protein
MDLPLRKDLFSKGYWGYDQDASWIRGAPEDRPAWAVIGEDGALYSGGFLHPLVLSHGKKERSMRKILMLLIIGGLILTGCIHFKEVSTNIAPTATASQKYPAQMAVYFTPRLKDCMITRRPDTIYGNAHEYNYVWGPSLVAALTKSVQAAYANVTVVNELPKPGDFERVLEFDLPWVDLLVEFVPGYLNQEAKADARMKITMEVFDGKTMKSLKTFPVDGEGSSSKDASGFAAHASMQFTGAMEKAIQQLSEIVSNLLISGGAEPRSGIGTRLPASK